MAVLTPQQLDEIRLMIDSKRLVPADYTTPDLNKMCQAYEDWYEANSDIPARDLEHDLDWPNVGAAIDAATAPYTFSEGMKKISKGCYLRWKERQPPQTKDVVETVREEIRTKQRRPRR